jgi:hypothetical protein
MNVDKVMKWLVVITSALFIGDMICLYVVSNIIFLPLIIGGAITIAILLIASFTSEVA